MDEDSQLYQLLADYSTDAVWLYNIRNHQFIFISPAVRSILGYTVDEAKKLNVYQLVSSEDYQRVNTEIGRQLKIFAASRSKLKRDNKLNETNQTGFDDARSNPNLELRIKSKAGDMIWCELNGRFRMNKLNEIELIGSIRDISKRKKNEERIVYLSFHDQLTTLYNRHFYVTELRRLDVERNLPISLIVSDINGLKATNDIFGHLAGDGLLVKLADVLRDTCRADDIVARIGGDEFVVLLPKTNHHQCEQLLARIKQQVQQVNLEQSVLSVSFGSVTKEKENQRFTDLFKLAEDEMYNQKIVDRHLFEQRLFKHIEHNTYQLNKRELKHGHRVSMICRQLAEASGFEPDRVNLIEKAGLYHDIGKITVSRALLDKETKLTEDDIYQIRKHVDTGYIILSSLKEYKDIADIVLSHHERPDGLGYPRKLLGDSIIIEASLLSVADAYDTMLNIKRMKKDQVIMELEKHAGTQFNDVAAKQMIELASSKEIPRM